MHTLANIRLDCTYVYLIIVVSESGGHATLLQSLSVGGKSPRRSRRFGRREPPLLQTGDARTAESVGIVGGRPEEVTHVAGRLPGYDVRIGGDPGATLESRQIVQRRGHGKRTGKTRTATGSADLLYNVTPGTESLAQINARRIQTLVQSLTVQLAKMAVILIFADY